MSTSEAFDGFDERKVLVLANKGKYIAPFVAAEAMKDLTLRVDVEAGRLLFVERAESDEICPGALEREGRSDDINDVAGGADLF